MGPLVSFSPSLLYSGPSPLFPGIALRYKHLASAPASWGTERLSNGLNKTYYLFSGFLQPLKTMWKDNSF